MGEIKLYNYKEEEPGDYGFGTGKLVHSYRYKYLDNLYLIRLELDNANILEVIVYELDDKTIQYVGNTDDGNLYLFFKKLKIGKKEIESYVNNWIKENEQLIFMK